MDAAIEGLPKSDEEARAAGALEILRSQAKKKRARLLLLIDNLELILDPLKDKQWSIREVLSQEKALLLIGTSAAPIESTYKYEQPFYDFFQIHELRALKIEETLEVLSALARSAGKSEIEALLARDSARVRAIHVLAGGNPRTIVLLFGVLAQSIEGDVRTDLERLLDHCTPLYKARFEALAPQSRQIVDALALHWDPISAGELAELVRLDINIVSSQLNRLAQQGVVEKVAYEPRSKSGFQMAERFFNVWYLMRASRRARRKLLSLVEFLRLFYSGDALEQEATRYLRVVARDGLGARIGDAEYGLALAQASDDRVLSRAVESATINAMFRVRELREQLSGFVDLDEGETPLRTLADRHRLAGEIQDVLLGSRLPDAPILAERFGALFVPLRNKLDFAYQLAGDLSALESGIAEARAALVRGERDAVCPLFPRVASFFPSLKKIASDQAVDDETAVAQLQQIAAGLASNRALFRKHATLSWQLDDVMLWPTSVRETWRRALREGFIAAPEDMEGARAAAVAFGVIDLSAIAACKLAQMRPTEEHVALLRGELERTQSASALFMATKHLRFASCFVGDPKRAHEEVLALNPLHAGAWQAKATHLLLEGRHEDAEKAVRRALELEPRFAGAWATLAHAIASRDFAGAEYAFRRAIELDDTDASVWVSLGLLLSRESAQALESEFALREAIRLAPDFELPTISLAQLYIDQWSRPRDAETILRSFLGGVPSSKQAWFELGRAIMRDDGRESEAETAFLRAADLDDASAQAWSLLGEVRLRLDRPVEAEAAFRRSLEIEPTRSATALRLFHLLIAQKRYSEAGELAQDITTRAPDDWSRWLMGGFSRGLARLALGRVDEETERDLRASVSPGAPNLPLACALFMLGKKNDAVSVFVESLLGDSEGLGWPYVLVCAQLAVQAGVAGEAVARLDETGATERWRPLREALAAISESPDILRRVAPEVRRAAEEVLAQLTPVSSPPADSGAKKTKRVRKRSSA